MAGKGPAMRKLARQVGARAGHPVEADFTTEGRSTTWYLRWANGPTADRMRTHTKAVAQSLPGLDLAQVGYRRDYSDRHLLAALLRRAQHDERVLGGMLSAHGCFDETAFPADIADDDPLWELVDYAFAACGGPHTYVGSVIDHVLKIGVRGLLVEYWLDQPDGLDPQAVQRHVQPLLDLSALSEATLRDLRGVAAAIVRDLAGNSPRRNDPRVHVLVAEVARTALAGPVDEEQRRQALYCVVDGTPLYKLSAQIGRSESALARRWNTVEFNRDLAALFWLRDNENDWAQACVDAAAEVNADGEIANDRDVRAHAYPLKRAGDNPGLGWRWLLETPEHARHLLQAVPHARRRGRSTTLRYGSPQDDREVGGQSGPALQRLADLLAQHDSAPIRERRGVMLRRSSI